LGDAALAENLRRVEGFRAAHDGKRACAVTTEGRGCGRTPRMPYEKKEVSLPRLAGASLSALASALDVPGVGDAIRKSMMGNVGILPFRARDTSEAQWSPASLFPLERGVQARLDLAAIARAGALAGESAPPTIAKLATKYRDGSARVEDVSERVIDAIAQSEKHTPAFRFFIAHDPADVRAQAKESAARFAAGKPLSVLDGVPVAIKDEVDQRGYRTTGGTRFLGDENGVQTHDAHAVANLRAQGAILVGKANMHELGMGTTGLNPHHGTPRNPHDPSRHTGGSSSGSGAVVASGIVPLALGADGGGSIRNPSSLCGVVGIKPTFGRVSERGAVPICWSVAHIGPIASSVADCALGYAVMAGPDAHDVHSQRQPPVVVPDLGADADGLVRGLRIGVFRPWIEDADGDVVQNVMRALGRLENRGAKLVDVDIPDLELARVVHLITIGVEMAAAQDVKWQTRKHQLGKDTRINMMLARGFTPTDYVHAQRHRTTICAQVNRVLEQCDVIASPAVGCTAPPVRDDAQKTGESDLTLLLKIMRFAPLANITGLPAISVPCGVGQGSLPVGLMAMGRAFDEATCFRVARAVELDTGWLKPRVHHTLW
jgi:Asp-tRNA(Asn)/Glu-tRNA(Gln) amidotransferase A subunit family amidase